MSQRTFFGSAHSSLDPSPRPCPWQLALLELLAARGLDRRVLTAGVFDSEQETPRESVLPHQGVPARSAEADLSGAGTGALWDFKLAEAARGPPRCSLPHDSAPAPLIHERSIL